MLEQEVVIRCRQSDKELIEQVLPTAKASYLEIVTTQIKKIQKPSINMTIDLASYLPEFNAKSSGLPSCIGGIEMKTKDSKIVCNNTLDKRFEQAYQDLLPEIRKILFA
jgi:vacuolar-type H+-ATPase subunit E/Vma4